MKQTLKKPHVNGPVARSFFSLLLFSIVGLSISGLYLASVSFLEYLTSTAIENLNFQFLFAGHLFAGVVFLVALLLYLISHLRRTASLANSAARRHGGLLVFLLILITLSGLLLTRGLMMFESINGGFRIGLYWLHLLLPVIAGFSYYRHRRAGRHTLQMSKGLLAIVLIVSVVVLSVAFWPLQGVEDESRSPRVNFLPSRLKTASQSTLKPEVFMRDDYCQSCHADTHQQWQASAHRFSSFNNPFYRFSVNNTRQFLLARDGNVEGSRFCAGCHDPLPLISGLFDDPAFDVDTHPSASAGLTCSVCHSVTQIDSLKGNADFTLAQPQHYPFAFSDSQWLRDLNHLLIKSNPDFHKKTFLKPLHKSAEFCGSCHKVHIPEVLNGYRWLRGQNHYDSFWLSGVSGHNVDSFYYPKKAEPDCNGCHMKPQLSTDFGAYSHKSGEQPAVNNHLFASGNTALPFALLEDNQRWINQHKLFLKDSVRLDVIGFREGGEINGEFLLNGPVASPVIEPGKSYLMELVIRTMTLGHQLTNGTADSNQLWIELTLSDDTGVLAQSGQRNNQGGIDNTSTHLITNYLIDRQGRAIDKRNVEDIYTSAFNYQIPPGAADVVHYKFTVPEQIQGALVVSAKLFYRKFNNGYVALSLPKKGAVNNPLPVVTLAEVSQSFATNQLSTSIPIPVVSKVEWWQRLNDYAIALYRKPGKQQFRQAEVVFKQVEALGNSQGTLNLVRLYYQEGRLDEARQALDRLDYQALDNPWSAEWYSAKINIDNGFLAEGITSLKNIVANQWPSAVAREFDFSKDYRLLNKLADTVLLSAKMYGANSLEREKQILEAKELYNKVLSMDPENVQAHYGLLQIARFQGDSEAVIEHRRQHETYKPDELAEAEAVSLARALDPSVDRKSNAVIIYELN